MCILTNHSSLALTMVVINCRLKEVESNQTKVLHLLETQHMYQHGGQMFPSKGDCQNRGFQTPSGMMNFDQMSPRPSPFCTVLHQKCYLLLSLHCNNHLSIIEYKHQHPKCSLHHQPINYLQNHPLLQQLQLRLHNTLLAVINWPTNTRWILYHSAVKIMYCN